MPNIIVISGANGAGKSTLAPYLLRDTFGIVDYVNADTIAEGLSAFAPEKAAFDAGRIMLVRLNQLAAERKDFAFDLNIANHALKRRGYNKSFVNRRGVRRWKIRVRNYWGD